MMKPHPDQQFGNVTHAQHGDDLMLMNLAYLLGLDSKDELLWLDIGAHHPTVISNTKLLYDAGFRGVNIEANPSLIDAFLAERKRDMSFQTGIGPEEGTFEFHIYGENSGRNTFSTDEVESMKGVMTVRKTIRLPVIPLNKFVDTFLGGRFPPLLLVDAEGMDYSILENTSFEKNPPSVVCVETRRGSAGQKMVEMMTGKKFDFYCRMGENLFFVHERLFTKVFF